MPFNKESKQIYIWSNETIIQHSNALMCTDYCSILLSQMQPPLSPSVQIFAGLM